MENKLFVPENFVIPPILETDRFRLRMLTAEDAEKDHEAVMETKERLRALYGGDWPWDGFTVNDNRADLAAHQQQFLDREAFAYTVVTLDESRVLGCVYIIPVESEEVEARVDMWVRQSEFDQGLDAVLFKEVKQWIGSAWPFKQVIYPGRE